MQKISSDAAGISKLDLKRQNRMHVLRFLRNNGPTCRVDIAEGIGITKAAVTIIINEMIDEGILRERGEQPPDSDGKASRGRKKILIDVNETWRLAMGLLLDDDRITLGLCTLKGKTVEKQTCPMPDRKNVVSVLRTVREMYESLLYKNDLKPEQMVGMGICISPEYYDRVGYVTDAQPGTSALELGLRVFCDLPLVFGTVTEGAAMAEIDFRPEGTKPPVNVVVQRVDRDLDCTIMIGREIYRGGSRKPGLAVQEGSPARCLHTVEIVRRVHAGLGQLGGKDILEDMTRKGVSDPARFFSQSDRQTDNAYFSVLYEELEETYFWLFSTMLYAYAPDRLVLVGEGGVERAVESALRRTSQLAGEGQEVCRSILREQELFRGAAALAVREFFVNRGGL